MQLLLLSLFLGISSAGLIKYRESRNEVSNKDATFESRFKKATTDFPLGVEAVMSVALRFQQISENTENSTPRNFLLSPLAVAGALGQLSLGAGHDLRKHLESLLTLPHVIPHRLPENASSTSDIKQSNASQAAQGVTASQSTADSRSIFRIESRMHAPQEALIEKDNVSECGLHCQLGGLIKKLSSPLQSTNDEASKGRPKETYLHAASAFFVDGNLEVTEKFNHSLYNLYGSSLVPVNFSRDPLGTQKLINDWGSKETGGIIRKFLEYPPSVNTAVMQLVTVHFRGAWKIPFIPYATIPGQFRVSENSAVPVQFMRGSLEDVPYADNHRLGIRMAAMPYENSNCFMYVLLPTQNNPLKYDVGKIAKNLNSDDVNELLEQTKYATINMMFPKLSLTSSVNLKEILKKYMHSTNIRNEGNETKSDESRQPIPSSFPSGNISSKSSPDVEFPKESINSSKIVANLEKPIQPLCQQPCRIGNRAFSKAEEEEVVSVSQNVTRNSTTVPWESSESEINLAGATTSGNFKISEMIQQISLQIDEAGTEAAAAVGSTVNYSGFVKIFKVNRPFLFFIRHERSMAILFWGIVVDPTT